MSIIALSAPNLSPAHLSTTGTFCCTSHPPPTLSSQMDLGLGSDDGEKPTPAKRMAVGGTTSELNKQVMTLSKLVMSNSMNVRHLQGALFDTWRLLATSDFVTGIREATRLHTEAMKKQGNNEAAAAKLGPPHIHAWNAIVQALTNKEMSEHEAQQLKQYIAEANPKGWKGLLDEVRYCRVRKTYDKEFCNLDLALTPGTPSYLLKNTLHRVLSKEPQAKLLAGHAAQGALERACQGWIDSQHV
jgi:hypothetical protein